MKTVLITGGSGLLGQRVIPLLLAQGVCVRALSRRPGLNTPRLTWIQGDLRDPLAVPQALAGADTLLHLATQPLQPGADLALAQPLLQALPASGIQHAVYMSIAHLERMQSMPYYREKLDIERRFEACGVPLTLQRSTQFHEFVVQVLQRLTLGHLTLIPTGVTLQPVEARAVAHHLAQLTVGEPAGRVRDLAGPDSMPLEHLARQWQLQQGRRPTLLRLPLPIPLFRAWQHQAAVGTAAQAVGRAWSSWLADAAPEDTQLQARGA
ncbi:NmrA family NAD(P)-binding protein (plasmid) [Deinococcus sp. KNUC1210]|uniref:SDR family oxidoreductase n=1 Tax=Deinococcus sp. KNUC1210 TaxID=2917691 RepID=UPI001EF0F2E8|nr:NmrA family NAD(P)-binding protein [Deinococcus sp. KNUC1210]ULH18234.1 NmrA family NAD(P)-binding protein [Deinococcus sp. KNUC1210]